MHTIGDDAQHRAPAPPCAVRVVFFLWSYGRAASPATRTHPCSSKRTRVSASPVYLSRGCAQLDAGVPVDSLDDDENTPLIIAAEGEDLIVELLLERGADIDKQNRNGVTALVRPKPNIT
jgi:hypothetical protein